MVVENRRFVLGVNDYSLLDVAHGTMRGGLANGKMSLGHTCKLVGLILDDIGEDRFHEVTCEPISKSTDRNMTLVSVNVNCGKGKDAPIELIGMGFRYLKHEFAVEWKINCEIGRVKGIVVEIPVEGTQQRLDSTESYGRVSKEVIVTNKRRKLYLDASVKLAVIMAIGMALFLVRTPLVNFISSLF